MVISPSAVSALSFSSICCECPSEYSKEQLVEISGPLGVAAWLCEGSQAIAWLHAGWLENGYLKLKFPCLVRPARWKPSNFLHLCPFFSNSVKLVELNVFLQPGHHDISR